MSRHNYTNPAFCQKSEFYQQQTPPPKSTQQCLNSTSISVGGLGNEVSGGVRRIQRSVSTRSFHAGGGGGGGNGNVNSSMRRQEANVRNPSSTNQQHLVEERLAAPKPGPKPRSFEQQQLATQRSGSGRYALVPVEELSNVGKDRYAIVPGPTTIPLPTTTTTQQPTIQRFTKSQDNLDCYSHHHHHSGRHVPGESVSSYHEDETDDTFTSLPPMPNHNHTEHDDQPRMKAAFSSDFGSKSFVLVDQKNNQRYAVVPTADDEDIVDDNHEIIQMLNGRAHRYAVIPTEDDDDDDEEEETCLSTTDLNQNYSIIQEMNRQQQSAPLQTSTPQKLVKLQYQQQQQQQQPQIHQQPQHSSNPCTPIKNPAAATRKLQELLSTPPRKIQTTTTTPAQRTYSTRTTPTNLNATPRRYKSQQQIYVSQQSIRHELTPQRLQYESKQAAYLEARTTAVIQPRLAQSNQLDNGENSSYNNDKSWNDSYPQKLANATATLGVVSLMLILGSALNSGLCLYLIANAGRSFFLEFGLAAAFAGVGLGILGFRSRHCDWLPNRSYISGYILVTVFCLLKCCGLLVLLALDPYPGMPLHDVTTGIILGLSTFTIFFIGLGVLGSYWCYRPPPDNRVNVY